MTNIELKSLQTQLQLHKEVRDADAMILHLVRTEARLLLDLIKNKMFFEEGQTTVELTNDEFAKIRLFLARLSATASDSDFSAISDIMGTHIIQKSLKEQIIRMLS